ncbi:hypothetical protein BTUL_0146g00110 [Botrytis tulipae]|uniref:Uncharacterized protein n=1 Tax=Botrytis tulipae TaxID=87230 RepID=A0A4Z1EHU8_9HELO|nr:hypothetical protein BTUL_0146g00110 [Botrytis tulipae]
MRFKSEFTKQSTIFSAFAKQDTKAGIHFRRGSSKAAVVPSSRAATSAIVTNTKQTLHESSDSIDAELISSRKSNKRRLVTEDDSDNEPLMLASLYDTRFIG